MNLAKMGLLKSMHGRFTHEVQMARDTALKAHQLFVHSDHAAATVFMHHVDQLNHLLAGLNRMSEKPTDC
jgi:hypothetical protein